MDILTKDQFTKRFMQTRQQDIARIAKSFRNKTHLAHDHIERMVDREYQEYLTRSKQYKLTEPQ